MWALMDFLNPGFSGAEASFDRRFLNPIRRSGDAEAAARLSAVRAVHPAQAQVGLGDHLGHSDKIA
jgi:SNF2 family DNA or RNA helicase